MDVRVEDLGPTRKRIHVVVSEDVVKREIDGAYEKLRKTAKVKGFRPGKTPRQILERYYGDYVAEQVISTLINNTYEGALSEGNVRPVSRPAVENDGLAPGRPFRYSAVVDVKPEIDVKDYIGIPAKGRSPRVEKDQVTAGLEELRERHAQLKTIGEGRPIRNGDFVIIDFQGTINGRPFKDGKGENVSVEVGAGRLLPDLEGALVGARVEETKEVEVIFPEDHGERHLAGKKAVFRIRVREVREKVLPPLDDEFAKDLGCESVQDLEKRVRDEIEKEMQAEINRELDRQILDSLIERNPFQVPESMVERRIETLIRELQLNFAYQGMEFEASGLNAEELRDQYRDRAVREVKSALLLNRIAEVEGIDVTGGEIRQKYEEIAKNTNRMANQVEAYYRKHDLVEGLKAQILEEKTLQFLRDRARVTETEAEEEA